MLPLQPVRVAAQNAAAVCSCIRFVNSVFRLQSVASFDRIYMPMADLSRLGLEPFAVYALVFITDTIVSAKLICGTGLRGVFQLPLASALTSLPEYVTYR